MFDLYKKPCDILPKLELIIKSAIGHLMIKVIIHSESVSLSFFIEVFFLYFVIVD